AFAVATRRLYKAFESAVFDPAMPRFSPTVTEDDVAALGGPVAEIPAPLVARFVLKVGTTWGGPDDLRRVAPRALELSANGELPLDRGLLSAKLRWADWPTWPTYQVTTVREFLRCEWCRLLRS